MFGAFCRAIMSEITAATHSHQYNCRAAANLCPALGFTICEFFICVYPGIKRMAQAIVQNVPSGLELRCMWFPQQSIDRNTARQASILIVRHWLFPRFKLKLRNSYSFSGTLSYTYASNYVRIVAENTDPDYRRVASGILQRLATGAGIAALRTGIPSVQEKL